MKKLIHKILNIYGYQLIKPELIHNNGGIPGGTVFSRRLVTLREIYKDIEGVEGDIFELGVHWGYGILLHHHCKSEINQRVVGFDSFQGHSKPTNNDYLGGKFRNFKNSFEISEDDVYTTMAYGLNITKQEAKNKVTFVKGYIQNTLPQFVESYIKDKRQLALVHCDVDIYEPFLVGLENSWKILNKNGVIIIGKLNNPELMGKTVAFNEFIAKIDPNQYEIKSIDMLDLGYKETSQLTYLKKLA